MHAIVQEKTRTTQGLGPNQIKTAIGVTGNFEVLTSIHQVSRSIDVKVPTDILMAVLCDFERYPEFVSNVLNAKLQERFDNRWRVWFEVILFRRNLQYALDLSKSDEFHLTWKLVQGDWMSKNTGSWSLTPIDERTTRAVYSIQVTIEGILPHAVSSLLIDASVPRLLRDFKRHAERLVSPPSG